MSTAVQPRSVIIVGAGPSGLMAAERLSAAGMAVDLFDAMPSVGRKFLLAGKGGLNLTHAEPVERFVTRYGTRQALLTDLLRDFGPEQVRVWAKSLGVDTFVGTSGHVFPADMKAAPLLRAWLTRLRHPRAGRGCAFTCATAGPAAWSAAPMAFSVCVSIPRAARCKRPPAPSCWRWGWQLGAPRLGWCLGALAAVSRYRCGTVAAGQLRL